MTPEAHTIQELKRNRQVFNHLLSGIPEVEHRWKPAPDKWCLLEIVCHLHDEEREDFRARVERVLQNPEAPLTPIDPEGWVKERKYAEQDYDNRLEAFLSERDHSVNWLESLEEPQWTNTHHHPKLGPMTATQFLKNWLAHDYLHIRQIVRTRYQFLVENAQEDLGYAGKW